MQNISIGRQPVLDEDLDLCAYEVLYRGSEAAQNRYTSASIINNVLNKFGTKALLGKRRAFVKIDKKFLLHDIIFSIPKEFFIFSLLADTLLDERVVERLEQLFEKGYILSIDSVTLNEESVDKYRPILHYVSYMKINVEKSNDKRLSSMITLLQNNNIIVVADNINSLREYENAKKFGCQWFQGYFFVEPKIVQNAKYEPSQMAVLKLYNLIMQDVNIDEIAKEFENNHAITLQLLQFINSGAFHFKHKISSIHHILTLVGRIPLGQWLMLMIYSKSISKEGQSPLMLTVKNRTSLMENILKVIEPGVRSNMLGEAYFVGVLSLMDTLYGVRLEEILQQINISCEVESAILKHEGLLGDILALVKDIESFNPEVVHEFEEKHSLKVASIEKIVVESMKDLNEFERLCA